MRHSKRRHILGVSGPHRSALLGNLSVALITHGRIKTTLAKAKGLRPFIEKVITLAKKAHQANDAARKLHFRRLAISRVRDKKAVAELFDTKVEEFTNRPGGYTRIYKLGQRVGDAAEMALIELINASDEGYPKPSKKARKPAAKKETEAEVAEAEATEDSIAEEAEEAEAEEVTEEVEAEAEAEDVAESNDSEAEEEAAK
jgi:large subunit ribosomal protein L17